MEGNEAPLSVEQILDAMSKLTPDELKQIGQRLIQRYNLQLQLPE